MTSSIPPVAVVTGAARGLGRALVEELCARDVAVAGIGRSLDSLAPLAEAVAGKTFLPLAADVTDAAGMADAFAQIKDRLGPVQMLINNAAVYPRRDILEETPDSFMQTIAVNLGGPMIASHEALKQMVETGEGRIVTVTSFAGQNPGPMSAAYGVSKDAARAFSRGLHGDLHDRFPGILIFDWIPGVLNTSMGRPDGHDTAEVAKWGASLAMTGDRALNGAVFVKDTQQLPPQSFKSRLFDKLLGRRAQAHRLTHS